MPTFKLNALLAISWLFAIVAYLAILNNIAVNGYQMKKIQDGLSQLETENKRMTLDLSDKQSIEGVMARVKDMKMVDAGSVTYLNMPSTVMVKK